MNLQEELYELKKAYDSKDTKLFEERYMSICENFPEDKKQISDFIKSFVQESIKEIDKFIGQTKIKIQLAEVSEIVSLSYIARKYFKKTRQWMYQRINGDKVNGKEASFTQEEIAILNAAIQDIAKKLNSKVVSL